MKNQNGTRLKNKKGIIFKVGMAVAMAACLVTGSLFAAQTFTQEGGIFNEVNNSMGGGTNSNLSNWSTSELESFDVKYVLTSTGGSCISADPVITYTSKKDTWLAAVSAGNIGKKVLVTMEDDWQAPGGTNGYIGTGDAGTLAVNDGFNVTFDLNGHTLDRNLTSTHAAGGRHFDVNGGGTLTIMDTVGTGVIKNGYNSSGTSGINVTSTSASKFGTLIINGGTFTNHNVVDAFGSVINVRGVCIINGGVFSNNGLSHSGAPGVIGVGTAGGFNGSLTMNGGEISGNIIQGGAVTVGATTSNGDSEQGTFIMNGGAIKENKIRDYPTGAGASSPVSRQYGRGAGVCIPATLSSFTMNGGVISNNTATFAAGGVFAIGNFTMNGGSITGNKSGYNHDGTDSSYQAFAGGVAAYTIFTMNGGEITNNTSRVYAGGMYCSGNGAGLPAQFYFNAGTISGNKGLGEGSSGGGIFLDGTNKVVFKNITVTGNSMPNSVAVGGGIVQASSANGVEIAGALICKNNTNKNGDNNYGFGYNVDGNANKLKVTGKLTQGGQSASIGLSLGNGLWPSTNLKKYQFLTGYPTYNTAFAGDYFYPDKTDFYCIEYLNQSSFEPVIQYRSAGIAYGNFEWWYLEDRGGVTTWKKPATITVSGQSVDNNLLELTYDPNCKITGILGRFVNTSIQNPCTWCAAAGDGINPSNLPDGCTLIAGDDFANYNDTMSPAGTSFTYAQEVGNYTLGFDSSTSKYNYGNYLVNDTFTIQIKPVDVTVTLNSSATGAYGDKLVLDPADADTAKKLASVTSGSANVEDLGLKFTKTYGTDAGVKNVILPIGWTNSNYNVTFTGKGFYTVQKRNVTVVLNDDYMTYGDATAKEGNLQKTALNGSSSIVTKTINKTTKFKDKDGKDVSVEAPATPPTGVLADYYKGGWYYSTDIGGGKASSEFIGADTSNGTDFSKIFEYDIGNYSAGTDLIAGDTDKYLNVKKYQITVKNKSDNYNVTFVNAQTGTSGSTGSFIYEVREAEIKVDTTLPSLDTDGTPGADFLTSTYDTTNQTVELPAAAVQKKGAKTATTPADIAPTMQYWSVKYTEKQYTDSAHKEPEVTPAAGADGSWLPGKPQIKDAGKYKIYVKITMKNHDPLVYGFVFEMKALELDFEIELYRKPTATGTETLLVRNDSGVYSEVYNGQAITAKIKYKSTPSTFAADTTKPDIVFYYKGTDSGNTYGIGTAASTPANTTNPDESLMDDPSSTTTPPAQIPAGLGNKTAPKDGGDYLVTLRDEAATQNYVLKSSTAKSVAFKITQKEVTAPTDPTGTVYYDATFKEITIPGFNADEMKFVADTTNGYVEDTTTTGSKEPDAAAGEKLAFSAVTKKARVKNAGEYKIKFEVANSRNYVWAGDSATTREVTVTVKGAPVYIDWANTLTTDNSWKWELGTTGDITYTLKFVNNGGAAYDSNNDGTPDEVKIKLHYKKATQADDDKTLLSPANPGTLQIKATDLDFQTAGKLVLIVTIEDDAVSSNYAFDSTKTNPDRKEFTVDSASIDSSSFVWEYISDKTGAVKADWTDTSEIKFAYKNTDPTNTDTTGLKYTFNLKMGATGLDGYDYILLDTARSGFTSGYKLEKWDDGAGAWVACTDGISEVGKYRMVAALKIKDGDTEHSFVTTDSDGNEVKSNEGEAILEIEVKKGTFDLSGIKWGYVKNGKEVEYTEAFGYNGSNQTIQLINLPKGMTVAASGYNTESKQKAVGTYTAKVTGGITVDTRFEKPVIADNASVFEKAWEIVKGKVEAEWTTDERTANSHVFYLPVFKDSTVTYVEVKYYNVNEDGTRGDEVADGAIVFDPDNPKKYVAVMKIKSSEDGNYELVDETGTVIAEATKDFSPGADKIPVKITVSHVGGVDTFNGKPQLDVEITCTSTDPIIQIGNFDIEIYKCVNESNLAANITDANYICTWNHTTHNDPVVAGKYVIAVAFKEDLTGTDDFALMSTKFFYEIKKADVSGLLGGIGWGFIEPETDDEGNIILDEHGQPKYKETPFDPDEEIEYRLDDDGTGKYTPTLRQPVLIGIPNTQEKLDKLIEEGKVPSDTKLEDVLDILKELGILDEDGESTITIGAGASDRGPHSTDFTLPADLDGDNFEPIANMLPPGLVSSTGTPIPLNWEIKHKKQDKPEKNSTVVYDGTPKGLAELAGLDPNDEGKYYTIDNIKVYDEISGSFVPVGADFDPKNIDGTGKYQFSVKITDSANVNWNTASGGASPEVVTVEVAKQVLNVTEWKPVSDETGALLLPVVLDADGKQIADWSKYFELEFVDVTGAVVGKGETWDGLTDEAYSLAEFTLRLKVKDPDYVETTKDSVLETAYKMPQIGAPASPIAAPDITLSSDVYLKDGVGVNFSNWSELEARVKSGIIVVSVNGERVDYANFPLKLTKAGDYNIVLLITGNFYWDSTESKTLSVDLTVSRQGVTAPVLQDFVFDGKSYDAASLTAKGVLSGFDANTMSFSLVGSSKLRDAGDYEIKITLKDTENYYFILPEAPASATSKAASLDARIPTLSDEDSVANYTLNIAKYKLTVNDAARWTKGDDGMITGYTLPAGFDPSVDVKFAVVPYESGESDTPMASGTEIAVGVDYWYGLEIDPTSPDANNFETDGSRYQYQIELTGAAKFWNNTLGFLKNYWWILLIILLVLLLILIIVLVARKKKKNKILAEERRQRELMEERERQERLEAERREEKRLEREERMAAMRQQPPAPAPQPQPIMPQMPIMPPMMNPIMPPMIQPQLPAPAPQPAPAPAPQPVIQQIPAPQPAAGGASYEMMRMAEEKARAEERARMAEERTLNMIQEQQMRAAYQPPAPQIPAQPDGSATEERARIVEERARQMEEKLARMEMEDRIREATAAATPAPAPAPAPVQPAASPKEVSIKLPEGAANVLTNALSGIVGSVITSDDPNAHRN